jgi:hypothetical protein
MPYRILILESVRDETTVRREIHIRNSPLLREHSFEHMYALELAPLAETRPMPTRALKSQQSSLDEKELLRRLMGRVEAFKPDILLVHSGAVFQSFPDQLMSVLQVLKDAHPEVRIGLQPRPFEQYAPRSYLEYTVEMHELMKKAFLAQGQESN